MVSAQEIAAEIARRAGERREKRSRVSGVVALIAALGGPAIVTPIIMRAIDAVAASAEAARVRADKQAKAQRALEEQVEAAREACGRAENLARDAKSQSDATSSRVDSLDRRRRQ